MPSPRSRYSKKQWKNDLTNPRYTYNVSTTPWGTYGRVLAITTPPTTDINNYHTTNRRVFAIITPPTGGYSPLSHHLQEGNVPIGLLQYITASSSPLGVAPLGVAVDHWELTITTQPTGWY